MTVISSTGPPPKPPSSAERQRQQPELGECRPVLEGIALPRSAVRRPLDVIAPFGGETPDRLTQQQLLLAQVEMHIEPFGTARDVLTAATPSWR